MATKLIFNLSREYLYRLLEDSQDQECRELLIKGLRALNTDTEVLQVIKNDS